MKMFNVSTSENHNHHDTSGIILLRTNTSRAFRNLETANSPIRARALQDGLIFSYLIEQRILLLQTHICKMLKKTKKHLYPTLFNGEVIKLMSINNCDTKD